MLASEILRLAFGFAAVLAMIGLAAFAAQKAGLATMSGAAGRKRRLALREVLPLDARRRLAIVKCDDTEYLIVMGPAGETVIDKGLKASGADCASTAPENPYRQPSSSVSYFGEKLQAVMQSPASDVTPSENKIGPSQPRAPVVWSLSSLGLIGARVQAALRKAA